MCSSGFSEYNIVLFFYQDNLTTYLLFYSFFFTCKTSTQKTCVTISPTFFLSTYINIDNQTGIIIFILHYTQSGLSYRVDQNVTRKKGLPKTYIDWDEMIFFGKYFKPAATESKYGERLCNFLITYTNDNNHMLILILKGRL